LKLVSYKSPVKYGFTELRLYGTLLFLMAKGSYIYELCASLPKFLDKRY